MSEAPIKQKAEKEREKQGEERQAEGDYDIRGSWTVSGQWKNDPNSWSYIIHFEGGQTEGSFKVEQETQPAGKYAVAGRNARWVFKSGDVLSGEFIDANHMKGTIGVGLGSWSAVRK